MNDFLNSTLGLYIALALLNVATIGLTALLHAGKGKIEDKITELLPAEEAVKVNEILDVVDRLTEAAVQNANSLIVKGLKEKNLFTQETANALKQSVIAEVMDNLGPLKEKSVALLGPLENIIGQLVEKYVLKWKDQVTQLVKSS